MAHRVRLRRGSLQERLVQARLAELLPDLRYAGPRTAQSRFEVYAIEHRFPDRPAITRWYFEPAGWRGIDEYSGSYSSADDALRVAQACEDAALGGPDPERVSAAALVDFLRWLTTARGIALVPPSGPNHVDFAVLVQEYARATGEETA